ncbi:hypothetical protein BGY98DRAFT_992687 [Russula aff. rugulosa BPL654]|nr:hypothetical protein BGY98DRAFT_992687 [Russula aff. rugulosa BPL654]
MEASRRFDGKHVMLKKVFSQAEPHELRITRLFSSPPFDQDPRNHCAPLLDVIEIPNTGQKLMVMPLLRSLSPRFQTFGEFVAFFTQICEGLQFMHERNVAHRWYVLSEILQGLHTNNVMFDPSEIYPRGFHHTRKKNRRYAFNTKAKRFIRTKRSPRYYLLISGLSRHYTSREDLEEPRRPRDGNDTAYKCQGETPRNPFRTDIYHLGNLVRHEFMRKYDGFEFMQDLVDEMTHVNPAERPTIEDVVTRFSCIRESQEPFKLCSRLMSKHRLSLFTVFRHVNKAMLTFLYAFSRKAVVPERDHTLRTCP